METRITIQIALSHNKNEKNEITSDSVEVVYKEKISNVRLFQVF